MSNTLNEVSKTTIRLILDEPFYGHFFTGIIKEVTERVPTLAVGLAQTQMTKLYVNEHFWQNVLVTPEYRYGVIKHEILHIVLKHILTVKKYDQKDIFNIAADIVVNQYIEPHQLIDGVVLLSQFDDLNLETNRDVGYYYDKLSEAWNGYMSSLGTENEQNKTQSIEYLEKYINGDNEHLAQHDLWQIEIGRMTQAERDILEEALNRVIENTIQRIGPRGIGKLPAGLKAYLDSLVISLKPKLNWRRVLRIFTANASRTYIKNTIRRPSKRYGTTPGLKVRNKQKILIAIDTSGSISMPDLEEFFGEMYHIWRQGAEILVVECDTIIQNKYIYRGVTPKFIMGRGGTQFDAPIHFANDEYMPDAIVYFTDGYANVPKVKSRKPILWMVSSSGLPEGQGIWHDLPGRVVKI
ncbi:MAG: putative metal-dependent peptidase [Paraglaciecola sp.]|jgi:predicted metal-dependent peptidase